MMDGSDNKVLDGAAVTVHRRPPSAGRGRTKGVPNKVTRDLRVAVATLVEQNVDKLQGWIDRIAQRNPGRAASIVVQLMEFTLPKLQRNELRALPPSLPDEPITTAEDAAAIYARIIQGEATPIENVRFELARQREKETSNDLA